MATNPKPITLVGINKQKAKLKLKKESGFIKFFIKQLPIKPTTEETLEKAKQTKKRLRNKSKSKLQRTEEAKLRRQERKSSKQVETKQSLTIKAFKDLFIKIKSEFNVANMSVYTYSSNDSNDIARLIGQSCGNNIVIERYFSFHSTTILVSPTGLEESDTYKSRFISRFIIDNISYMICLSSYAMEAFKGKNADVIVSLILKAKRKIGEIE